MREIKFRAWHKPTQLMDDVVLIDFYNEQIGILYADPVMQGESIQKYNFSEVEIMQYTGLNDENGKEIYEGDVVLAWDKYKYTVKYSEDRGGWYPFATDDGCGCCADEVANEKFSEIIGNIHEGVEERNPME